MGLLDDLQVPKEKGLHRRRLEAEANSLLKGKKVRRGNRKPIPRMSYRTYIVSVYWKQRKRRFFRKFGRACAVCGQKAGVTLHHKKYDPRRYGREKDETLVALCPHHHRDFHQAFGVQHDMMEMTNLFVKHERQVVEFYRSAAWLTTI